MTRPSRYLSRAVAAVVLSAMLSSTLVRCQDKAAAEVLPPWLSEKKNDTAKAVEEETTTSAAKIPGW